MLLSLPSLAVGQEFQRLKTHADSLMAAGYYDKAILFYDQALFNYRSNTESKANAKPPATDAEWLDVLIAKADATYKNGTQVEVPDLYWSLRYFSAKDKEPPMPQALLRYKGLKPVLKAKEFRRLKAEGDSLKRLGKSKMAINAYDKALQQVLSYNAVVNEFDWQAALYEASDTQNALDGLHNQSSYDLNAKYKKLIQTMPQKVAELKQKGINKIISFNSQFVGGTGTMMITEMSFGKMGFQNANYTHLIWLNGNDIYMQAFSDKNIRPPFKMDAPALRKLLRSYFDEMLNENIQKARRKIHHEQYYVIELYPTGPEIKVVKYQESDMRDPSPNIGQRYFQPSDLDTYNANIKTKLHQFELLASEFIWTYNKLLRTEFD
ncbi:hypothetical protein GCM10028827_23220 [Mucilaginibacter myungsuensis]